MRTTTHLIDFFELYVEVHHKRGDFNLFEVLNPDTNKWQEGPTVWDLRNADDAYWAVGFELYKALDGHQMLRVTRYPDLEATIDDVTYHPSVPAWKINIDKVKEHFNG
jgi:hypothetical protein